MNIRKRDRAALFALGLAWLLMPGVLLPSTAQGSQGSPANGGQPAHAPQTRVKEQGGSAAAKEQSGTAPAAGGHGPAPAKPPDTPAAGEQTSPSAKQPDAPASAKDQPEERQPLPLPEVVARVKKAAAEGASRARSSGAAPPGARRSGPASTRAGSPPPKDGWTSLEWDAALTGRIVLEWDRDLDPRTREARDLGVRLVWERDKR